MSRPTSSPLDVVRVEQAPRDGRLRGAFLGLPRAGDRLEPRSLHLCGWVLPEAGPASGVVVTAAGSTVLRTLVDRSRPDIEDVHPDLAHSGSCGFDERINLIALTEEIELDVRAVLSGGEHVPLAAVTVRPAAGEHGQRRVTVVIPCFNQAHFLADAIESVLRQTTSSVAIAVVDDGSTDNVEAVAGRYPGVAYLRQENRGLAHARNAGLESADGEFVLFLDADDRLLPEAIEIGLRELDADPDASMVAGAWQLIGEDGQALPWSMPAAPAEPYRALLESCFISTPAAVLYRRRIFDEIGRFDPKVSASADYDIYLRAAARGILRVHRRPVAEYRRHGANMTRDPELIMRAELAVLERRRSDVPAGTELAAALQSGLDRSRTYHGQRLVEQVRRCADAGLGDRAAEMAAVVAELYPAGSEAARDALGRPSLR